MRLPAASGAREHDRALVGWAPGGDAALVASLRAEAEEATHEAVASFLGAPIDMDVQVADPGGVLVAARVDVLVLGSRGTARSRAVAVPPAAARNAGD